MHLGPPPFLDNKAESGVHGAFILSLGEKNKAVVSKKSLIQGSPVKRLATEIHHPLKDGFRVHDGKRFKGTKLKL